MLIVVIYGITCFFLGTVLFKKAAGTLGLRYPNIMTLTYYYLVVFFLISAALEAMGLGMGYFAKKAIYGDSPLKAFYATYAAFVFLPMVVVMLQKILHMRPRQEGLLLFTRSWKTVSDRTDVHLVLSLITIGLVLTVFWLGMVILTHVPLIEALKGSATTGVDLAVARHQWAWAEERWVHYVRNIGGFWLAPLASLISLGYWLMYRRPLWLILCLWLTLIATLYLVSSLAKSPLVFFLLFPAVYIYGLFRKGFNLRLLCAILSGATVIIAALYFFTLRISNIGVILSLFFERVFFGQYSGTILTFDMFPRLHPFLGASGLNLGLFGRLFGYEGNRYSLLLMQFYNPEAWAAGRAGYMSTLFLSEGYACWGVLGIAMGVFVVALWLVIIQWLFFRVRLHPISVSFLSLLAFRIVTFIGDGLSNFLYSSEIIAATIITLCLVIWVRMRPVLKFVRPISKERYTK